jgi:hypothetical protein
MKALVIILVPSLVITCGALADRSTSATRLIDALPAATAGAWPNQVLANCPFPKSESFAGIVFTGRHSEYTQADTWYPSWASDDKLYSPWNDGTVNGLRSNSAGKNAVTGHATILGKDPLKLQVVDHAVFASDPAPYSRIDPGSGLMTVSRNVSRPVRASRRQ